jgi:pimeloyl-ACP methyl ester carboxylesterase
MTERLQMQEFGEVGDQPTLLVVHGLFGAGRNWRGLARNLAKDRRVVTVDMRNHGESFWDASNTYRDLARDLSNAIDEVGAPCDVLGHSMGGKAAMVLALEHGEQVNRLIVADIAPVAYEHSQISNIGVMKLIPIDQLTRRSEADEIMAERIAEPDRWALNLDALEANMADIVGFPDVNGRFTGPALFLRGGKSPYVREAHRVRVEGLFPNATIESLADAGHWLHADNPRGFLASVSRFLEQ